MQVKTNAGYIFDQLECLLKNLTEEQYCLSLEIFSGASLGKHYRHIIEFFQAVSLADQTETICYDNRLRDVRIEKNRMLAKELLLDLKNDLAQVDNEKRLTLIGDLASNENSENAFMITSLYREFHYAVEHAIHHMAIIKMAVKQTFPEVNISREFGIAPSTLRHEQSTAK